MKRHSRFAWGLLWAGVMIFLAVQVVSAEVSDHTYWIEGTISSMTGDGLVFEEATVNGVTEENVYVYGMGPASYWAEIGVPFPQVDDEVIIEAYYKNDKYVAAAVIEYITQAETEITLREVFENDDGIHLIPLWSNSNKLLPETVTTVISAIPLDCTCDCKCYCQGDACDCSCDCEDCLENRNQYQKGKKNNP